MILTNRELLRLHLEAVWGIELPPLSHDEVEIRSGSELPPWGLYIGLLGAERIAIWRPGLDQPTRHKLYSRAEAALSSKANEAAMLGVAREVVLYQSEQPMLESCQAHEIAQAIEPTESELFEAFEKGSASYYGEAARGPLFGVVRDGRLLSLAHSSRRTAEACELGIDTRLEARRRGYALACTVLWAEAVRREGLIPFYSAFASNSASLKLAQTAGYRPFAEGVSISKDGGSAEC